MVEDRALATGQYDDKALRTLLPGAVIEEINGNAFRPQLISDGSSYVIVGHLSDKRGVMPETARGDQGCSHAPSSRPGGEANAYGAVRSWNGGGLEDVVPRRKPDPDYLQGSAPQCDRNLSHYWTSWWSQLRAQRASIQPALISHLISTDRISSGRFMDTTSSITARPSSCARLVISARSSGVALDALPS